MEGLAGSLRGCRGTEKEAVSFRAGLAHGLVQHCVKVIKKEHCTLTVLGFWLNRALSRSFRSPTLGNTAVWINQRGSQTGRAERWAKQEVDNRITQGSLLICVRTSFLTPTGLISTLASTPSLLLFQLPDYVCLCVPHPDLSYQAGSLACIRHGGWGHRNHSPSSQSFFRAVSCHPLLLQGHHGSSIEGGGLQVALGIELLEKQIESDPLMSAIQSSPWELVESVETALMWYFPSVPSTILC